MNLLRDLTEWERALVVASRSGDVLACDDDGEPKGTDNKPAASVRAELLRELLLGHRGKLDPRGIRACGVRITGTLDLSHVTAAVGLDLVACVIDRQVDLSRATIPRLALTGCRAAGLRAGGLRVGGDLVLSRLRVDCAGDGAVFLRGAHIDGVLDLDEAQVRNDAGPALYASGMRVCDHLLFRRARMTGSGALGAVRFQGTQIRGVLDLDGTEISNDSGPALHADRLHVDGVVLLRDVHMSGAGQRGTLRVLGARIGDGVIMEGLEVRNDTSPALDAAELDVRGNLRLDRGALVGIGERGAVRLRGAHVSGAFTVTDTEISNRDGPAILGDSLHVSDTIALTRARLSGDGPEAAVCLAAANIGGQLTVLDTDVANATGNLFDLHEARVTGGVHLPPEVVCGEGIDCTGGAVDFNGFTYASLVNVDWRRWLHLVRCHTSEYQPSPYQRLAAVERAAGHDGNARNILIAQQHDLRQRAPAMVGGWMTRRFHWLWGALAGYGYRTRRIALALAVALLVAAVVSLWAGHITTGSHRHAAEHTHTSSTPRTPCSTVELIGLGLDRGLPLGPTGLRTRCDLDTESTAGQAFTVVLWIVQAAVWGLATLALAGYTGLIRKST